jgi:hypothetical protein
MGDQSPFRNFVRAFGSRWFVLMSGPLGVPLVLVGAYFSTGVAQIALSITAVVGAVFAAFWVWREQFQKVSAQTKTIGELREAARPKLKCLFSMNDSGCVRPGSTVTQTIVGTQIGTSTTGEQVASIQRVSAKATYFRVKVTADSIGHVSGCCGFLDRAPGRGVGAGILSSVGCLIRLPPSAD